MKFLILFLLLISANIFAQQPVRGTPSTTQKQENRRTARQADESSRRFEALKSVGEYSRSSKTWSRATAIQNVSNIYRAPTKEESKLLSVSKEDFKNHEQFLRQPKTGLTKLIFDRGCADYTGVLNVSEECLQYSMPGAGSSFSFRTENYRIPRLSDLTYGEDGFYSPGILSHGIIVKIGDVPLEQITAQTAGLKYLSDFEIASDFEKARQIDEKLNDGIENNNFFYCRKLKADESETYVLRSIAYRGSYYRALDGFVYDELDFDERRDVTVAFRIISRDENSVTILWKILSNQKAPAIKKPTEAQIKAEENKFTADTKEPRDN